MNKLQLQPGDKFGKLTIIGYDKKKAVWACKCACGAKVFGGCTHIKNGKHTQCLSCSQKARRTLKKGDRFGRLTVIKHGGQAKGWLCKCDCGKTTHARTWALKTGEHQSCSCGRFEERPQCRLPENKSFKRDVMRNYMRSASRHTRKFELSEEQFFSLISQNCHYCGSEPRLIDRFSARGFRCNGVDRIDNSIGYIEGNCVPCCEICNMSKRTLSIDEWKAWLRQAYKHQFGE